MSSRRLLELLFHTLHTLPRHALHICTRDSAVCVSIYPFAGSAQFSRTVHNLSVLVNCAGTVPSHLPSSRSSCACQLLSLCAGLLCWDCSLTLAELALILCMSITRSFERVIERFSVILIVGELKSFGSADTMPLIQFLDQRHHLPPGAHKKLDEESSQCEYPHMRAGAVPLIPM